jgi:hypothetical protein
MEFISNSDGVTSAGFQIDYREVQAACGGHLWLSSASSVLTIASPNYPNDYPLNAECSWVVTAPSNKRIQLDFAGAFSIEPHPKSVIG